MSKSTLYDIANEFEKSLDNLLDHDNSDLIKEIESIEGEFKSKSTNVAKYIRNLEHLALGVKEIESNQKNRRISLEKKIESLESKLAGLIDGIEAASKLKADLDEAKLKLSSEVNELKENAKSWATKKKEAMDTNKDGSVDLNEVYAYVHGRLFSENPRHKNPKRKV